MGGLFGSSGIRGPYPEGVHPDLALRVGAAAGTLAPRLLVGHDARLSSPLLAQAVVAGALSTGARVDAAGPAATPSLAYAARDYDAAIVVTASHNPAPDNGFKFWNPDGAAWLPDQEAALERALEAPEAGVRAPWDRLHAPGSRADVAERHRAALLRLAGPLQGRVVVDCGNGMGGLVTPSLFQEAGLDAEVLWGEPDGRFPNRPSEPSPENLAELRARCRRLNAWGIAHDGDADRMVPVDPTGAVVPPERVLVALALLVGARRVATPVDASLALARALPGVAWEYTRVGDAHVSAAVRTSKADLGAETSGTYVLPRLDHAPDGPAAAFLFLHAARQGLVEEAARRLGPVHRLAQKMPAPGLDRARLRARLEGVAVGAGERATRVDGLRVDTPEGWFLVRASGTEPLVRITAEGASAEGARRLFERAQSVAHAALAASQATGGGGSGSPRARRSTGVAS